MFTGTKYIVDSDLVREMLEYFQYIIASWRMGLSVAEWKMFVIESGGIF